MYEIRWDAGARQDMKLMKLRKYEVAQIVDAVEEELPHAPERQTRHKKIIRPGLRLPFLHVEPVWQFRVGEFRVFYDVATEEREHSEREGVGRQGVVSVRAVRRKPAHKTTEEIL